MSYDVQKSGQDFFHSPEMITVQNDSIADVT